MNRRAGLEHDLYPAIVCMLWLQHGLILTGSTFIFLGAALRANIGLQAKPFNGGLEAPVVRSA